MGSSALMSIATRAMTANYAALQTTGHNIANASVTGYSRQEVQLQTSQGQFTGAGFFGKGVDVKTVARAFDQFLQRASVVTRSQAEFDSARLDQLSRLEQVFQGGEQGVGYAAGEFLNAVVDMASHPQDLAARQVVLSRAGDLASRFANAGQQLDAIQTGVSDALRSAVARVNEISTNIAQVNDRIAVAQGSGHTPNDLLDQRDQLIKELGGYMEVTTIPADDGTTSVFVGGGQRLVLGAQALKLQLTPDTYDSSRMALGIVEASGVRPLPYEQVGSGSIGGLLRFQDSDLVDARTQLGQMAAAVSAAVNAQQSYGLDLRVPPGTGAALFTAGTPQALPAQSNARTTGGAFAASVGLTVTDASQLQASEYSLVNNGSAWVLTRLADGSSQTVVDGSTVDGFRINLGTPAPAATDRFLLQPVTRAANAMARILDDPRALAAASPVAAQAATANTGTASVDALRVVSTAVNPQNTATISFTNASGAYSWELRDRSTNALVSSGTGTWTAGQPIALNGFELTLTGVPASGDVFTVSQTQYPGSNNGNALALAALRDALIVGRVGNGAGGLAGGRTITDAWADALGDIGVRTQSAKTASDISTQVATSADQALSARTGVNLDEEAARLMQFQQGYQAAAKVLQIAQSIFDSLLQAAQ
ncbi:MAG: flagellar hook-associated protein FlgK [Burkholderiaceae bacterium]